MCSLFSWGLLSFVVQLLSCVHLFATPWTAAHQASLPFTISQSLLKLMSIKLVMPSNHLILCHPLLLPSIFPSIRVFSSKLVLRIRWPKFWSFSFSISPSSAYSDTQNYSLLLARTLLWNSSPSLVDGLGSPRARHLYRFQYSWGIYDNKHSWVYFDP